MKRLIVLAFFGCYVSAPAQNVGIGTTTPAEKLDVNGNLKISGYLNLNGNIGTAGQILSSQGTDPAKWIDIKSLLSAATDQNHYAQASPDLFTGDIVLKSSHVAPDHWYDGVGLVSLGDTLFAFGGWYTVTGPDAFVINTIRYSLDDGANWIISSYTLPFSGHSFVYFKAPDGWLYIIGCDAFTPANYQTVWRTKNMQNFTVMTTTAGWSNRTVMGGWADENGNIYIAGGQNSYDITTGPNDIWQSSNSGATWSQVANNITANGEYFLGQNISNAVKYFNKRVYVVAGGIAAAVPNNTYSKKVYSASIDNLTSWRKEKDIPYNIGRRYSGIEVWDGKLWAWAGNNATEGNVRTLCYMDESGTWHDFKYVYTDNNPANLTTQTHAAGIAVHKDMLYRVMGNFSNEAYALKRSSFIANINIRDTLNTKTVFVSSMAGSGTRLATVTPQGELKASSILESDVQTISGLAAKAVSNQVTSAQPANLWINGKGIFGTGTDVGKTLQVFGDGYISSLLGIGTSSPAAYMAGVPGIAVYSTTNAGIALANTNKYWMSWISNTDLKFFEGGAGMNRLTIKAGGVVNIDNLSGSGTRMVIADASGNLSAQVINPAGEINTASNQGTTTFGLFKQKVGTDLQFKSLATPTDAGIELVSNTNDVLIRNNAYEIYGKAESTTVNALVATVIKLITPLDNSAGTLEVDMSAISTSLGTLTGKKYARYKKVAGVITLGPVTDVISTIADGNIAAASWFVSAASGDLQVKVMGVSSSTIKWRAVYKLNQVIP